ncbi:multicopper oxidase domain-containing protein [Streptomyces sp. NBC_00029]|uniref:multicopper oxidase domain-containing protein n=1 Tax=Streptomyces sp. NBC_00029 TaxID=2903613 RepID=UPI00386E5A0D
MWEYVNPHHDAHPMHVHLVNFQVLNRQPIDAAAYQADSEQRNRAPGDVRPPLPPPRARGRRPDAPVHDRRPRRPAPGRAGRRPPRG